MPVMKNIPKITSIFILFHNICVPHIFLHWLCHQTCIFFSCVSGEFLLDDDWDFPPENLSMSFLWFAKYMIHVAISNLIFVNALKVATGEKVLLDQSSLASTYYFYGFKEVIGFSKIAMRKLQQLCEMWSNLKGNCL